MERNIPTYYITIDELEEGGIDLISLVENPAIMIKGLAFNKNEKVFQFKYDDEKQIIAGPAIIPDFPIYRCDDEIGEYYVVFKKEIIEQMVEKFNKNPKQLPINLEHTSEIVPAFIKGSWIIEDTEKDKSKLYGFDSLPLGTYFIEVKVTDKEYWERIKKEEKTGFSIEGMMGLTLSKIKEQFTIYEDNVNSSNVQSYTYNDVTGELILTFNDGSRYKYYQIDFTDYESIVFGEAECITEGENEFGSWFEGKTPSVGAAVWQYLIDSGIRYEKLSKVQRYETYNDYPKAARNNACKVLEWRDEYGDDEVDGMTRVGWIRANQLCKGEKLSEDTIARMSGFQRHKKNSEIAEEYKGTPWKDRGYVAWLGWGGTEGIEWASRKLEQIRQKMATNIPHYTKDGKLWTGKTHKDANGRLMTGAVHSDTSEYLYHLEDLAEVGERGGINPSKKAPKSDTPNKNPKGEGTAKGDASSTRGAEVSERVEKILKEKSDEFNEKYKEKLGYGVNLGMLKSVYQRGVGAFNVSHSPEVKSSEQWALARVNAFLYIVKTGRPENKKYVGDNDLLPKEHPKRVELNNQINKNQNNMKKKLIFKDYTLKNGSMITIDGDMEIGSTVYSLTKDGEREQAMQGEYVTEDGTTVFVDEEGFINEVRTAETTEEKKEEKMEVTPEEIMAVVNPMFEEMRTIIAELQSRIEMMEGKTDDADILQVEDEEFSRMNEFKFRLDKLRSRGV